VKLGNQGFKGRD